MLHLRFKQLRYHLRHKWRTRSRIVDRVFLSSVTALAGSLVFLSFYGVQAESALLRSWFYIQSEVAGRRPSPASVAIIQIDTRSKKALGVPDREAIPRSFLADAVTKLMHYQPKAIFFDIIFDGKGPSPEIDERLAQALARSPSVIGRSSVREIEGRNQDGSPRYGRRKLDSYTLFVDSAKFVIPFQLTLTNNVVEKIALVGDPTLENFPLLLPLRNLVDPTIEEPKEYDLINYYGEPFTIPAKPLYELLQQDGSLPESLFKNKVVFIGWAETVTNEMNEDKRDSFLTPVSKDTMYGVEIHATIAANLLDRSWLRRLPPHLEMLLVLTLTLVVSFVATSLSWKQFVPFIVFAGILWLIVSFFAFIKVYYFLPALTVFGLVMPAFAVILAIAEARAEARKRRELEEAIGLGSTAK